MYTGTRPGLTPAIRAEKGWRGRRELAPRRSATQLAACRHDPGQTRRVLNHLKHTHQGSGSKDFCEDDMCPAVEQATCQGGGAAAHGQSRQTEDTWVRQGADDSQTSTPAPAQLAGVNHKRWWHLASGVPRKGRTWRGRCFFLKGFWDCGRVCGDRSVFVTSHRPAHLSRAHASSLIKLCISHLKCLQFAAFMPACSAILGYCHECVWK